MKTLLAAIVALLFNAGLSNAQTIPALINSNGVFLTATTRAVPPVNVVPHEDLVNATNVILLDEKSMKVETGFTVTSFKMTMVTTTGNKTIETDGSALSKEMIAALQQLKTGDKVYFEYIKAKFTEGTTRSLPSMAFQVR